MEVQKNDEEMRDVVDVREEAEKEEYNKGDLHGGKTTMLYLNLSGH